MTDRERGQRLLRSLLPWAKAEARKGDASHKLGSALGRSTAAYVTYDNLDAMMIYPAPLGGWHVDISMKRVPPGVPNTMGSPVAQPYRTRAEAEEGGKRLLVMMCLMAEQNAANPAAKPDPVFLLCGSVVTLMPEIYQLALAVMPEYTEGYASKAIAIQKIEAMLAELFPGGFDKSTFEALPHDEIARFMAVIHIAALTGVYAYPPRTDASPSGHRETSEARH